MSGIYNIEHCVMTLEHPKPFKNLDFYLSLSFQGLQAISSVKLVFRSIELKELKVAILDVSVWKLILQFSAYIKFIGKNIPK